MGPEAGLGEAADREHGCGQGCPLSLEPWQTQGGAAGPFSAQPGGWERVRQPDPGGIPASQTGSGPSAFTAAEGPLASALFG